jgi:hypothetical protein
MKTKIDYCLGRFNKNCNKLDFCAEPNNNFIKRFNPMFTDVENKLIGIFKRANAL